MSLNSKNFIFEKILEINKNFKIIFKNLSIFIKLNSKIVNIFKIKIAYL